MSNLIKYQARKCYTAAGMLIENEKILLIKHRKLNMWLCPGGHLEKEELPHQAAEREFFEETGVRVKAIDHLFQVEADRTQYLPNPIETNLHWVSQANYEKRLQSGNRDQRVKTKLWPKGCEQHLNFLYLVKATNKIDLDPSEREVTDIAWFNQTQLEQANVSLEIKDQFYHGLEIIKQYGKKPFFTRDY